MAGYRSRENDDYWTKGQRCRAGGRGFD